MDSVSVAGFVFELEILPNVVMEGGRVEMVPVLVLVVV